MLTSSHEDNQYIPGLERLRLFRMFYKPRLSEDLFLQATLDVSGVKINFFEGNLLKSEIDKTVMLLNWKSQFVELNHVHMYHISVKAGGYSH